MKAAKLLFSVLTCVCAAMVAASPAQAEPPRARFLKTPSAEPEEDDGRNGLLIGGAITMSALYFNALVFGMLTTNDRTNTAYALIPVVGPFVAAGLGEPKAGWLEDSDLIEIGFIVNGVGQVVGTTLTILGIAGVGDDDHDAQSGSVRVVPVARGADLGLGVSGSF